MSGSRDVWITGIGILSCVGEGNAAHVPGCEERIDPAAAGVFAPYPLHRLCAIDFTKQIPKTSEQRQMGLWQRIGVYAAGLALTDAGVADQPEVLDRTHLVVAAGNGERDCAFDAKVLGNDANDKDDCARLNEALLSGLRPTLYLGELSNLLAGNISIVHHATGSSRTFKGEEIAGVSAVENAYRRIAAGQGDVFLVGGALNAEREDLLLGYELGRNLWAQSDRPVWSRREKGGGFIPGSVGAFLVIEASEHAQARGRKPYARIGAVCTQRCARASGQLQDGLKALFDGLNPPGDSLAVLTGACGVEPATSDELAFLRGLEDGGRKVAIRAYGSWLGHGVEAHFPMGIGLSALAIAAGRFYAPSDDSGVEHPYNGDLSRVLVTGVGHWRGEGLALVERIE